MTNPGTLREVAVALRRAGRSRREIKDALDLSGDGVLSLLLDGEPPPEWTKRPNAKDAQRERARKLREQGWTYDEIVDEIDVVKSSVSLWTRDVSTPELELKKRRRSEEGEARRLEALRAWQDETRRQRALARQQTKFESAKKIGDLSERDVLMAGALIYWCEGAKDKPYDRREKVKFINSDPELVRLFLRFLGVAGVEPDRLRFRVHIHETADLSVETRYWADVAGEAVDCFEKPVIKRHSPKTNRKNVGGNYHGCLDITVLRSAGLYRQIEGWAYGAMLGHMRPKPPEPSPAITGNELPRRLRQWRRPRKPLPSSSRSAGRLRSDW